MNTPSAKFLAGVGLLLLFVIMSSVRFPVSAAPELQLTDFPTPTAGPDGRIVYIVQAGDTLWRISAVTELSIDEIRLLNNLGVEDVIIPGQQLLLGLGGPSDAPTQQAAPTEIPANVTLTPTPGPGVGDICIALFDDLNGDAQRQSVEEEPPIPGGAISISNRSGSVSLTGETTQAEDEDPLCFEEVPGGDYNITVAVPEGYNPTTILNYALQLVPGDDVYLNFGAQISTEAVIAAPPPEEGGRSPVLGIVGGLLVAGGIGLGFYVSRMGRTPTRQKPVQDE